MVASYPGALKTYTDQVNQVDIVDAADINSLQDEVEAIEAELGVDVAGAFATLVIAMAQTAAEKAAAQGDLFYATGANAVSALSKGTGFQRLRMNAGATAPEWGDFDDGWVASNETWTYASASTFTVPTDLTAKYQVGTKIKMDNSGTKYFHVESSSYGAPNTTVTVITQTDYTIANSAISNNFYSYVDNPEGFPHWFLYTPTYVGFSADPTYVAKFAIIGRTCILSLRRTAGGTSNATGFTITLPIVAATHTNMVWSNGTANLQDNGSGGPTGLIQVPSAATAAILYKTAAGAWTASGTKFADATVMYEI